MDNTYKEINSVLFPMLIASGGVMDWQKLKNHNSRYRDEISDENLKKLLLDEEIEGWYGCLHIANTYGSSLDCDLELTIKALQDFKEYGIDYDKSSNLKDSDESEFNGTDQEPTKVIYSYALLVSGNGNEYWFGVKGSMGSITKMVSQLSNLFNLTPKQNLETALLSLEKRIEQFKNDNDFEKRPWAKDQFGYCCRLSESD